MNLGNRYAQHSFAQIPSVNLSRTQLDRSYQRKQTIRFDYLNPFFVEEIVPGDTINLSVRTFSRLITQVAPLMDRIYLDYFFFFVPNRLTWDNWEKFCGSQNNPGDSTDYVMPSKVIAVNTATVQTLYDYYGLPLNATGQVYPTGAQYTVKNCLPLRCYGLIWNEWFRDENLQNRVTVSTADGPDTTTYMSLIQRNRKQDYFTSALPWPQKGDSVTFPFGTSAPVVGDGTTVIDFKSTAGSTRNLKMTGGTTTASWDSDPGANGDVKFSTLEADVGLYADLTTAASVTVNQFRQSIMIQSLLELDARGGTRYVEVLLAHYGVTSPDFRLQRPEYLGGGREELNSHPIPQTSETSGSNYQANLASFGTAQTSDNSIGFSKSFVEHGYVIGLVQARGEMSYQQGMNRMYMRETRYDFFWPKLQQLGEQSINKGEIYFQGDAAGTNYESFGYAERYAEYKFRPSEIVGQFRSQYATPLDQWHLAPLFTSQPQLNTSFLVTSTPISRNVANTGTTAQILQDLWFDYKHARPMVSYAVPATLGRF